MPKVNKSTRVNFRGDVIPLIEGTEYPEGSAIVKAFPNLFDGKLELLVEAPVAVLEVTVEEQETTEEVTVEEQETTEEVTVEEQEAQQTSKKRR